MCQQWRLFLVAFLMRYCALQRLRQRQEQLNAARLELENLLSDRKVELADMETLKSHVEDLRNLLEDSSLAERKSFIKSFFREVRVTGTEVLLSYSCGIPGHSRSSPYCTAWWAVEDLNLWPLRWFVRCSLETGKTPRLADRSENKPSRRPISREFRFSITFPPGQHSVVLTLQLSRLVKDAFILLKTNCFSMCVIIY